MTETKIEISDKVYLKLFGLSSISDIDNFYSCISAIQTINSKFKDFYPEEQDFDFNVSYKDINMSSNKFLSILIQNLDDVMPVEILVKKYSLKREDIISNTFFILIDILYFMKINKINRKRYIRFAKILINYVSKYYELKLKIKDGYKIEHLCIKFILLSLYRINNKSQNMKYIYKSILFLSIVFNIYHNKRVEHYHKDKFCNLDLILAYYKTLIKYEKTKTLMVF